VRPVNLIPPEERRGEQAPLRSGPLAYIVLGALVLVLAGVTAMVLADNQISERESEVAKLESEDARAAAKAQRLAAYTEFQAMSEQRVATVSDLADSRFDWERVMRELALVLPGDVWLTDLIATASPGVSIEGGGSSGGALRAQVPGPAMEINGCATGQGAVAGFVTALKDIDGVTRVGVESSELGEEEEEAASTEIGADTGSSGGECRTRSFIAKFAIVVAFDAAPVSTTGTEEGEVAAAPTETAESTDEAEGGE
jgi:Tfp pilus assembly protein PilN